MGAAKPTTILFVLLTGLSLTARAADSGCARLLAPSFQSRELSTDQKFRAYMEDLLEGGELGFDVFADFSKNLNEGILANPVTEEVALLNWELHFHKSLLQEYVDSGELDVEELGKWALERLEKMERDRSGQETVSEEVKEVLDIDDVISREFWEQVSDRYLKYIPVGEKISGTGGMEAIHFAVKYAPLETLKKFVDIHRKDLNVNAETNGGWTPLMYAIESGGPDAVNVLVKAGADVNAENKHGKTSLIFAAWNRNPDAVNVLVKAGADVNAENKYGKTSLMYAAESGSADAVRALVKAGATVNAQNRHGDTPLMYAAKNGSPGTVSALVNAGADVNAQNRYGDTPLMYAVWNGNTDAVNALVDAGAAVNAENKRVWTPLFYAARSGNPEIVNALVNAGANVNAQDKDGTTPLLLAVPNRNPDVVNALGKAGAKK